MGRRPRTAFDLCWSSLWNCRRHKEPPRDATNIRGNSQRDRGAWRSQCSMAGYVRQSRVARSSLFALARAGTICLHRPLPDPYRKIDHVPVRNCPLKSIRVACERLLQPVSPIAQIFNYAVLPDGSSLRYLRPRRLRIRMATVPSCQLLECRYATYSRITSCVRVGGLCCVECVIHTANGPKTRE
jgi:hypothetical protein